MPVQLIPKNDGRILEVAVTGKLTSEDYNHFVPDFEKLVERHGKISVLFDMTGFHGWEIRALWEDIKFDAKHFSDIDRLAMVGNRKWEKWMSDFCRPFTRASIRFFDETKTREARTWITEKASPVSGRPPESNAKPIMI